MSRILIVEDNKTLAHLVAKKITSELGCEVDIAYKLSEAKLFLKKYTYFIALLDINLPDAPDGEVVDYVLGTKTRAIILSANIDKDFRKMMLEKNIIDYVNKGGVNDVNYIIQTIKRLQKNQQHTILVVDDSVVFRKQMQKMLENMFFKVITVAHGEEALGMLEVNNNISLVLTDHYMPVMQGLELTVEIRKIYSKNDLGIIAVSSNNDDEVTALFLKNGANDYIYKPFSKEEFSCRVNNSIEALENIHTITNHANRDYLTGLYNRRYFFEDMEKYFLDATARSESFAIAMIDIDNFKIVNDTYGHDTGDKVISHLADMLRGNLKSNNDLVARFGGEEFCIALKNISQNKAIEVLEHIKKEVEKSHLLAENGDEIRFTISIGVAINPEDTLEDTIGQADMLLYNAKQNGKNKVMYN
ncbi:MAG: diguanylate cyclase [Sulfurimonadaceae bacterium]|jgi:diguanylate cyclase (GGDEF)-like protein|nr:diguanylate cyclase [Sulfurimonadaceae bacterium]